MTSSRMEGEKIIYDCFLYSFPFQFGPHVYNGKRIAAWDVMVCDGCYRGNWDGIVPQSRPHLVPYFTIEGDRGSLQPKGLDRLA
jgi:hypothetical protein